MNYKEKDPTESDIFNLYRFYESYKKYYEYYWVHIKQKNVKPENIRERIRDIYGTKKIGGVIEALCFYTNIPKEELFNSDGTPKNLNEIEVLDMIMEANYGQINN